MPRKSHYDRRIVERKNNLYQVLATSIFILAVIVWSKPILESSVFWFALMISASVCAWALLRLINIWQLYGSMENSEEEEEVDEDKTPQV